MEVKHSKGWSTVRYGGSCTSNPLGAQLGRLALRKMSIDDPEGFRILQCLERWHLASLFACPPSWMLSLSDIDEMCNTLDGSPYHQRMLVRMRSRVEEPRPVLTVDILTIT